jgi:phenylpropionate dioxygenase-like ring-hydroxylating dioxygenase large terminal subunit
VTTDATTDFAHLVRDGAVHSAIYTDESVFEAELQRIFYRDWVYLAHESEVPRRGDYCTKWIGRQQVIVVRDSDDEVHAFFNRCRHRGTALCNAESGNADFFRCPYHGWTYNNRGKLVAVTYPSRYETEFDKDELGLAPLPRFGEYRGFLFGSVSADGPDLLEHLGRTTHYIDLFLNGSPSERVELRAGASKSLYRGNWKFVGMDGYHVNFVHKTVLDIEEERFRGSDYVRGMRNSDKSPNESWDLGGGHSRLNLALTDRVEIGRESTAAVAGGIPDTDAGRSYFQAMIERWGGRENAEQAINNARDVHLHVWPNLQLIGSQVRVIRPLSAGLTEVIGYPAMLADVPDEINEKRLRAYEWFNGVAGFGGPDDTEIFERNQIGLACDNEPWLVVARGMAQAERREDGTIVGNITDEVPQRAQLRRWIEDMRVGVR